MTRGAAAERLGLAAAEWLLADAQAEPDDLTLYAGRAGVVIALVEARAHTGDARFAAAVSQGADALSTGIEHVADSSLSFGLTGVAVALLAAGRDADAARALRLVRERCDERQRWGEMFELLCGNAGIALGALHAGDLELAVLAATPYLSTADVTPGGVNWAVRPSPARSHHVAHGTLGIVHALAAVGAAAGRDDMVQLALAGAADVVQRNDDGPHGFLVPHSDPPHRPDVTERYSYGWCNGPAGDAQVFRLLARVTADEQWEHLENRCWTTILRSGLPHRVRPGFWDNSGRCCGTAGVLALACDRLVERGDDHELADELVDDLYRRATVDDAGARWSNLAQRPVSANLPPSRGWAMGSAGILRELLRYARTTDGRSDHYAVAWPDHPVTAAGPAGTA